MSRLYQEPWRFTFFQAVRLIQNAFGREKHNKSLEPVGSDASPVQELIAFTSPPSLAYTTADIVDIQSKDKKDLSSHDMKVAFMGVAGVNGGLPSSYTETILQRARAKDTSMRDFHDLFNHRAVSLFYRAWQKYRLPYSYEAHKVHGKTDSVDPITNALLALVGHRVTSINTQSDISSAEKLLYFGGVYASSQRSPLTLAELLSDYFKVPIEIEQFVGEWGDLYEDDYAVLGQCNDKVGQNNKLGLNTIIGSRVYCVESRFCIVIGPLKRKEFEEIKPGSQSLHALCDLAKGYVGPNVKFDLKIKLDSTATSCARLNGGNTEPSNLGWNTWLIDINDVQLEGQITEIHISSNGL